MPRLIIKKGDLVIKKLSVPDEIVAFTVGCERGNDIVILDDDISFFHLQFEKHNADYYVRDLQSQWGTFVNGNKISQRTIVGNEDEVKLGHHVIVFTDTRKVAKPQPVAAEHAVASRENEVKQQDISTRISGVPALNLLKSWLDEDEATLEHNADTLPGEEENGLPPRHDTVTNGAANHSPDKFGNNGEVEGIDHEAGVKPDLNEHGNAETDSGFTFEDQREQDIDLGTEPALATEPASTSAIDFNLEDAATPQTKTPTVVKVSPLYLLGIYGYYRHQRFRLRRPKTRLGRSRQLNDIVIKKNSRDEFDQSISRRHATIEFVNRSCFIINRSRNIIRVNHTLVEKNNRVEIEPGDEIEIVSDRKNHIFRLVRTKNWDYSYPKRAGGWFLRHRRVVVTVVSAALIVMAAATLFTAVQTRNFIVGRPDKLTIKETLWGSSDVDTKFSGAKKSDFAIYPAIADLNGDGFVDLVYVNNKGHVTCVNGKSKAPLWSNKDFQAMPEFPVTIAELYGKGAPAVVVVSEDSRVRAIDGKWGVEMWRSPILAGPLMGPPAIADFNGDGLLDFAIASRENAVYIGYSSLRTVRWSKIDIEDPIRSIVCASDVTGDGVANILLGTESGSFLIIDGLNKRILGSVSVNEELQKATGRFEQNNPIRFPIGVADLDGDGAGDIVVSSVQGNLVALNGLSLERMWYDLSREPEETQPGVTQGISLGDLDGDGLADVVHQTPDGRLRAIKGLARGKDRKVLLWEYPKQRSEDFVGQPVLVDFNKNGTKDILAVTKDGVLHILEGATGQLLLKHAAGLPLQSPPLVADLDNDNNLDILVLRSDGRFWKIATNSLTLGSTVMWDQMYGNHMNTGFASQIHPEASRYNIMILISALMMLAVAAGYAFVLRKGVI